MKRFPYPLFLFLGLTAAFLWHCAPPAPPAQVSFYFWKTSLEGKDSIDWAQMRRISGDAPLYLRLFDVDYSAGYGDAIPVGALHMEYGATDGRVIVPTIYITNRVFERLSEEQLKRLAGRVDAKIRLRLDELAAWVAQRTLLGDGEDWKAIEEKRKVVSANWLEQVTEIQLDCDWTTATRDKYFFFLKELAQRAQPRQLSCTIRLHQYRDRKTAGIPPVQRGVLMCYNVADPKQPGTPNAIFDPALISGYLKGGEYPLPLDVALPLFRWGAWFRGEKFLGLMSGWDEKSVADAALYQSEGEHRYRLLQDTVLGDDFLREGDLIRLDYPDTSALLEVATLLRKRVKGPATNRLLFFDWDNEKIRHYEPTIQGCLARFE